MSCAPNFRVVSNFVDRLETDSIRSVVNAYLDAYESVPVSGSDAPARRVADEAFKNALASLIPADPK